MGSYVIGLFGCIVVLYERHSIGKSAHDVSPGIHLLNYDRVSHAIHIFCVDEQAQPLRQEKVGGAFFGAKGCSTNIFGTYLTEKQKRAATFCTRMTVLFRVEGNERNSLLSLA